MAERSSPPLLNLFRKYISAFIIPQKPSHWAIVDAMPNAGHGLLHTLLRELELECFTGILESPVTVEQRVCIRIFANCLLKCVKYQLVVIASAYDVGDNRLVIEIEDGAQIELFDD